MVLDFSITENQSLNFNNNSENQSLDLSQQAFTADPNGIPDMSGRRFMISFLRYLLEHFDFQPDPEHDSARERAQVPPSTPEETFVAPISVEAHRQSLKTGGAANNSSSNRIDDLRTSPNDDTIAFHDDPLTTTLFFNADDPDNLFDLRIVESPKGHGHFKWSDDALLRSSLEEDVESYPKSALRLAYDGELLLPWAKREKKHRRRRAFSASSSGSLDVSDEDETPWYIPRHISDETQLHDDQLHGDVPQSKVDVTQRGTPSSQMKIAGEGEDSARGNVATTEEKLTNQGGAFSENTLPASVSQESSLSVEVPQLPQSAQERQPLQDSEFTAESDVTVHDGGLERYGVKGGTIPLSKFETPPPHFLDERQEIFVAQISPNDMTPVLPMKDARSPALPMKHSEQNEGPLTEILSAEELLPRLRSGDEELQIDHTLRRRGSNSSANLNSPRIEAFGQSLGQPGATNLKTTAPPDTNNGARSSNMEEDSNRKPAIKVSDDTPSEDTDVPASSSIAQSLSNASMASLSETPTDDRHASKGITAVENKGFLRSVFSRNMGFQAVTMQPDVSPERRPVVPSSTQNVKSAMERARANRPKRLSHDQTSDEGSDIVYSSGRSSRTNSPSAVSMFSTPGGSVESGVSTAASAVAANVVGAGKGEYYTSNSFEEAKVSALEEIREAGSYPADDLHRKVVSFAQPECEAHSPLQSHSSRSDSPKGSNSPWL